MNAATALRQPAVHRFVTPVVREMTPAEAEAQRRLVRESLLRDR